MWQACKEILDHWIGLGVRIFRVDNPHTKPIAFWDWVIPEVQKDHPEVIFLAEAFTRPHVMARLRGGLSRWLDQAREAGLEDEDVQALVASVLAQQAAGAPRAGDPGPALRTAGAEVATRAAGIGGAA